VKVALMICEWKGKQVNFFGIWSWTAGEKNREGSILEFDWLYFVL